MAPLPAEHTYRVWMEYTSGDIGHDMLLRFNNADIGPPIGLIAQRCNDIANAVFGMMAIEDAIVGWRYANEGQTFSLPCTLTTGNGSQSGGTFNDESRTCFVGLAARSSGARHVHYNLFTVITYTLSVYRQSYADAAANFQALLDEFQDSGPGDGQALTAIDGAEVLFKQYFNIGQNAYWQRAQR